MMNEPKNPEDLHKLADNMSSRVNGKWVNPGTPSAPLVTKDQMPKATIEGKNADKLKAGLVK